MWNSDLYGGSLLNPKALFVANNIKEVLSTTTILFDHGGGLYNLRNIVEDNSIIQVTILFASLSDEDNLFL